MNANLAALLYLVAGVLFILSLRGLSSPASSRQGKVFGMIGRGVAVVWSAAGAVDLRPSGASRGASEPRKPQRADVFALPRPHACAPVLEASAAESTPARVHRLSRPRHA